jgi:hypothetical protein
LQELEDKQAQAEEKAKRDAEAEEKAKAEVATAVPAEPKQSIKDRGAALNLRVGASMACFSSF